MPKLNILNKKYNRLTVIKESKNINGRTAWVCKCDCGNKVIVKTEHLRSNSTKSCGCLNDEKRKSRAKQMYSKKIKYSSPKIASANIIWRRRYKDGDISFEKFLDLSQRKCYYCDNKPDNEYNSAKHDKKASLFAKENGNFIYNGLDRIDSSKPHNKDNVVTCCWVCNYAKRDRSIDEFKEWIKKVYHKFVINNKN